MTDLSPHTRFRRAFYVLLVGSALAWHAVRVCQLRSHDGLTPFLSENDRSRWCAVVALVDHHTFAIDECTARPGWNTIDKVSHAGRDGRQHFYSSKPPLLAVILAGPYWLLKQATGLTLASHPFLVGRLLVGVTNGLWLAIFFYCVVQSSERWGDTDWGCIYVVAVATWGTFLTTFSVTINNHLPAAACAAAAVYALFRIWYDGEDRPALYAVAGAGSALSAANELPAAALLAFVACTLAWHSPRKTAIWFVPPAALVIAAFFGTNLWAHDSWRPPYAHRRAGDTWQGDNWYNYPGSYWLDENRRGVDVGEASEARYLFHVVIGHHGIFSLTPVWLLSLWGVWLLGRRRLMAAIMVVMLSAACLLFYTLLRPAADRNYGGVACAFRWMFWLIPLWIVALAPAADQAARRRWLRWLAVILLVASAASAAYGWWFPWCHPWLYELV
jgi:hypothetical protein